MNSYSTEKKEIRKSGAIAFILFGSLSLLAIWRQKVGITYFFGALSLSGLGFFLLPVFLKPIYVGWLKTTHLIGRIITIIMLTLAYYAVITPFALIKRILGGRPLPIYPNRNLSTYWVTRTERVQPRERYLKRY